MLDRKNILLINCPIVWAGVKRPVFPLGLAYIGTFLENYGHNVRLIDLNTRVNHSQEFQQLLRKNKFDFIGVNMRNIFFKNAPQVYEWKNVIKTVKFLSPYSKIVCGGTAFSLLPREIMDSIEEIDMGVVGRGEKAFLELIHSPVHKVRGAVFRDGKDIRFICPREEINLEDLPIPKRNWPDLDLSQYNALGLQTRQGCPFKCRHCQYKYFEGEEMRYRNLSSVHKEIEYLSPFKKKIFFVDNIFNYPLGYSLEIINILKRYNLEWSGYFRADLLNKDYIEELSKSGCKTIMISAESGSQPIHNYLNTGISVNTILNILRFSSAIPRDKMSISFSFMIGMPKERIIDIFKTFILIIKILLKRYSIGLSLFAYTPQSEIGREELYTGDKRSASLKLKRQFIYKKILYPFFWLFMAFDFIIVQRLKKNEIN